MRKNWWINGDKKKKKTSVKVTLMKNKWVWQDELSGVSQTNRWVWANGTSLHRLAALHKTAQPFKRAYAEQKSLFM